VVTTSGTLEEVAALLETAMEAVDDSKTIFLVDVKKMGQGTFKGILIHAV